MIAFPSARRAVQCARAIQDEIDRELGDHADGPIRLRIGLHTGEAIKEEADFYGKNIVLAARIADQANGGEILASSVVKQLTESAGDLHFRTSASWSSTDWPGRIRCTECSNPAEPGG
jgi:class 3 adenylate cyclase